MGLEELEKRIRVLEDIEAIKKLKATYCAYCDDNFNIPALRTLFVEDATWDGGRHGSAQGREAILSTLANAQNWVPFSVHMVMNPIIEVEGDEATGQWYLFMACTQKNGGENATWVSLRYDEEYLRVDGEWKFTSQKLTEYFWTPFDQGWVNARFG